jgi:hypothetical protein
LGELAVSSSVWRLAAPMLTRDDVYRSDPKKRWWLVEERGWENVRDIPLARCPDQNPMPEPDRCCCCRTLRLVALLAACATCKPDIST